MLRRRRTAIPALAAAAAAPVAAGMAATPAHADRQDRVERQIVRLINGVRHRHGKPTMRLNARMSLGASRHSEAMLRSGTMTHGAWYARVCRYAHSRSVGEVIAFGRMSPSRQAGWVVSAWMHSSTHRAVLLSGRFHRAGVGRRTGGGRTFFTLDTAR